jgi:RNA polymerase sigma factor (sigma-70 family)
MTELEYLLHNCRLQDEKACFEFYTRFKNMVITVCRRYVSQTVLIEECVQDTFINFFKALHTPGKFTYETDEGLIKYLRTTAARACLEMLRREKLLKILAVEEAEIPEPQEYILSGLSEKEIYQAILDLPDNMRIVFNLAELEDLKHSEIAALMEISETSSRLYLCRAKKKLKEVLSGYRMPI